jgi:hypothetical protein
MTVDELVELFATVTIGQDKAIFDGNSTKFNRLYDRMQAVVGELKSRPGDQRSALLPLYDHPNMQVRLKAAVATLDIEPLRARKVLEKIASLRGFADQAADARATLWRLDGRSIVL